MQAFFLIGGELLTHCGSKHTDDAIITSLNISLSTDDTNPLQTDQNIHFIENMLIQWSVDSSNDQISSCDALFPSCSSVETEAQLLTCELYSYFYFRFTITGYRILSFLNISSCLKEMHSKHCLHSFPALTHERWGVGGATGLALEPDWLFLMSITLEDFGTRKSRVTIERIE